MKKIIQIILLTCCLLPGIAFAQTVIRGTVKDNAGGVPGVSVQEKDSKGNGTTTNENGSFQLTLRGTSNILEISAIGFLKKEVNVAGKNNITITIEEDAKGLDEVVILGLGGSAKKITNTGAISTVSAADIRSVPT
ncbi:MAG: SusC/RagA family TonB-linked outer membrane protein, partial [Hymenobacter sp.]